MLRIELLCGLTQVRKEGDWFLQPLVKIRKKQ